MTAVYVVGGSQTDFARNWAREGLEIYDLFCESLTTALVDSGIEPSRIDVGHVGNFVGDLFAGQGLLGGFFAEVEPRLAGMPTSRHEAACASGSMAVLAAMRDIESGHYDVACVVGLEFMRNVPGEVAANHLGAAAWRGHEATDCRYPWPYLFDRIAAEYDRRYGLSTEHLRTIANINFDNAKRNPLAQTRDWTFESGAFGDDDELNPIVEGRLRKRDCAQITDGAACVLLAGGNAATDIAKARGLALADLPRIKGWGHRTTALSLERKLEVSAGQGLIFPHVAETMADAMRRAGIGDLATIDGLETHDCFTITEYMAIDHLGLTEPGMSGRAIEEGRIARDGDFPINVSGGLMGVGHPVGATGVRMVLDCARQVSGQAGKMQISDAKNLLTLNLGGSTTTCASFVVGVGRDL